MHVNSLLYLTMNFMVGRLDAIFDKNIFNLKVLAIILTLLIVPSTAVDAQQSNLINIGLSNKTAESPFNNSTPKHSYNSSLERTNLLTFNTTGMEEASSNPDDLQEHVSESSNWHTTTLSGDKNISDVRNITTTITMKTGHFNNTVFMVALKGENVSIFFGSPKNNDYNNKW